MMVWSSQDSAMFWAGDVMAIAPEGRLLENESQCGRCRECASLGGTPRSDLKTCGCRQLSDLGIDRWTKGQLLGENEFRRTHHQVHLVHSGCEAGFIYPPQRGAQGVACRQSGTRSHLPSAS